MAKTAAETKRAGAPACPICGRPRAEKYTPFCSARCADVDLYRWLNGGYVIPANEESPAEAELNAEEEPAPRRPRQGLE